MKKAGSPAVRVIGNELEAWRIDVRQGHAAEMLPQVETHLAQVDAWWQQHCAGQHVPEAPDPEVLARVLLSALDVAREAHYAQEDWQAARRRLDAILEIKRELERPTEDIAIDRMNRANVLGRLGDLSAAQAEMETCLQVFQHDPARRSSVLSSLAGLFAIRGDIVQAIIQERRALALREQLPDPRDRADSHHNLAHYLEYSGTPPALAESPRHQLTALLYRLVADLRQALQYSFRNYTVLFRRAQAAGTPLTIPRVADLLVEPAFRPLAEWLHQRQVDVAEVQAAVDQLLDQVRQAALESQ